jgi:chlorobactene glucosyltransferase
MVAGKARRKKLRTATDNIDGVNTMQLIVISGILFGTLLVLFGNLLINLLVFDRLKPATRENTRASPTVSILVPARNEADHIEECLRSLIGQSYEKLEVLVLDDQSTDETPAIVQHIIDELPETQKSRLRLLHGEPLPQGWIGKNFACYQLAQHAQGDYFLFTDADSIHTRQSVSMVINGMHDLDVQFLTALPQYILHSMGEHLAIPLLYFKVFTLLPLVLVRRRPEPILAVANGPLLCFRRSAYESVGGHKAVKTSILEDNLLARHIKEAGYRMAFVDGLDLVSCYMYDSFTELWGGFSRTFFSFYNYSLVAAAAIIILDLALFVVPPLFVLTSLFVTLAPLVVLFALGSYLISVLMRILLAFVCTRSRRISTLLLCLLHPVSMLLECLLLLNSIRWHYRKMGTAWKGRYYIA